MADRSVLVRLRADISDFQRKMATAGTTTSVFVKNLESADSRMGNLVQTALALAPALVPIAATGVPALAGLATQAGFAVGGIGVLIAAVHGMGDALKAMREYELEPTAENLAKVREEMSKLPESARDFVRFLDGQVMPALGRLREASSDGFLPGAEDGIDNLMERLPEVTRLVDDLATASGKLARKGGKSLAGDDFDEFFDFLENEAEPTLVKLGKTVGNVFQGLSMSLVGLNPLANDFEDALYGWSRGFADLEPEDFQQFVAYVRDVGPDAADTVGAISGALVAIVQAAAPVGSVALPAIEALANVVEALAESPAGPVLIGTAAGLSAVSRAMALFKAANGSALLTTIQGVGKSAPVATSGLARMNMTISAMKTGIPIIAALGLAFTDLDDRAGLSNTTMLATMGLMAGPWYAAAAGTVGLLMDVEAATLDAADAMEKFNASMEIGDRSGALETVDEMQKRLDRLRGTDLSSISFSSFGNLMSGTSVADEISTLERNIAAATNEVEAFDGAQRKAAADKSYYNSLQAETAVLQDNIAAMRAKRDEALRAADAELNWRSSILDARDALKKNGATLDLNTRAGIENKGALIQMAAAWNGQSDAAKNVEGAHRRAITLIARTAEQMGMSREAARKYAKSLLEIPTERKTQIKLDTDLAAQKLKAWQSQVDSLRDGYVTVHVNRVGGDLPYLSGGVPRGADGMTVPGQRLPYGDKTLIGAAPGEEVVSNRFGGADRNRYELKAASRGAKLTVMGYADGGTVGGDDSDDPKKPKKPPKPLPFGLPAETAALIRQFGSLRKALAASEKAVDRETNRRDYLQSKLDATSESMANLAEVTTAGFMNDPFRNREGASDIWAAGAKGGGVDPIASLDEDIAYGQRRIQLQKQLQDAGLGGSTAAEQAALAEALKGSNDDLAALLSNGQVQALEDKLIQRQSLGTIAGTGAAEMGGLNDVLRSQQNELQAQTQAALEAVAELRALRAEERARERRDDQRSKDNAQATGQATAEGLNGHARSVARQASRGWKRPA